MNNDQIMKQLINYAQERMSKQNVYPFCSFITKSDVIISKAYNNTLRDWGDKTTHGEMIAMKKACQSLKYELDLDLSGCYLYSTCEPCLACFDTALFVKIRTIIYSVDHSDFPDYFNEHPYTIDDYLKKNPGKITVIKNILHNDGIKLFKTAKKKYGW